MPDWVIFLDDGGVLNDNARRSRQWQRLLGEVLPALLGGTPEGWAEANRVTAPPFWTDASLRRLWAGTGDYAAFDRAYHLEWLRRMCRYLGLPEPPDDAGLAIARRAVGYVIPRIRAAFPGAAAAVLELRRQGHRLHTASGEPSYDLARYLGAMGIRDCFGRLYGPDLVNELKTGPAYYRKVFADAGVPPAEALVVDDRLPALAWAAEAGARTVLVGSPSADRDGWRPDATVPTLADLPPILPDLLKSKG